MVDGLKWARRMRLDLAFEIAQLETGVRKVTQTTRAGTVDITREVLAAQKERFGQVEEMLAAFGPAPLYD